MLETTPAEMLVITPRAVEKHVKNFSRSCGSRRRSQTTGACSQFCNTSRRVSYGPVNGTWSCSHTVPGAGRVRSTR